MSGYCPDCGNVQCLCKAIAADEAKRPERIGSSEIVRCWWRIADRENCDIGPEHKTYEDAKWYLEKCLAKKLQRRCRIVRIELHRIEAPNKQIT